MSSFRAATLERPKLARVRAASDPLHEGGLAALPIRPMIGTRFVIFSARLRADFPLTIEVANHYHLTMITWPAALPLIASRRPDLAMPGNTLEQASPGTWVEIRDVVGTDEAVEHLLEHGLTPETPLQVMRRAGGHIQVYVRGSLLSLAADLAEGVEVTPRRR